MANICSNSVVIEGNAAQLAALKKLIEDQDAKFLEKYWLFTESAYYGMEDLQDYGGSLSLCITTKWSPPLEELQSLSEEYPGLLIEIEWEEPGCEIFGKSVIQNGCANTEDYSPYDYYVNNYDEFTAEVDAIKSMNYDEFLEEYGEASGTSEVYEEAGCEIPGYAYLERHIVEKIKKEDLPLFMNYEWCGDGEELYKERMKGVTNGVDNNIVAVG